MIGAQLETSVGMLTSGRPSSCATPLAVSIALPPPMPTRKAGCSGRSASARRSIAACVHAPPKGSAQRSSGPPLLSASRSGGSPFFMAVSPPMTAKVPPSGLHSAGKCESTPQPMLKRGSVTTSVRYM